MLKETRFKCSNLAISLSLFFSLPSLSLTYLFCYSYCLCLLCGVEELLHVKFKEYGIDEPQYNLLSSQELYPPLNEEESEMLQLYHNLSLSQFLYPGGPCMARLPCRSGSEKNSTKELEWVYARIVECSSQQDEKQGSVRVVVDESVDGIPPNFEWHVCVSDMCLRPFSLDMVIEPHPSYTGLYTMNTRQMLQLPTEVL